MNLTVVKQEILDYLASDPGSFSASDLPSQPPLQTFRDACDELAQEGAIKDLHRDGDGTANARLAPSSQ